jgi:hypothetical protein
VFVGRTAAWTRPSAPGMIAKDQSSAPCDEGYVQWIIEKVATYVRAVDIPEDELTVVSTG